MKTQYKIFSIIIVIALGFLLYLNREVRISVPRQSVSVPLVHEPFATFVWETEPSNAKNADGQPKTSVFVKATYENGVVERKLVDVASGCNVLPEKEKDGAEFQCYAAGAGAKYKIVQQGDVYAVQRKAFEEAPPNKSPKIFEYETVGQFTLEK